MSRRKPDIGSVLPASWDNESLHDDVRRSIPSRVWSELERESFNDMMNQWLGELSKRPDTSIREKLDI